MATLTWSHIQTWITENPHKSRGLTPYVPAQQSVEGAKEHTDAEGWTKFVVAPSTPLSAVLLAQDPTYQANNELGRRALLRDETTDLQEKAVLHLKGRAWPVRRTAEGLVACGLEEGRATAWTDLGWRAVCALREVQIIVANQDKKTVSFYPEDVRAWSSEVETIAVDSEARFVWTHPTPIKTASSWLSAREAEGWTIAWPEAEGTMDELREMAAKLQESSAKLVKAALQKRVGRAQSVKQFYEWSTTL